MQLSTEAQRNAIKTATRLALTQVGGLEAASTVTRLAKSRLAQAGDRNAEAFAPADVVLDLDLCAGEPVITQALATAQGYLLMPTVAGAGDLSTRFQEIAQAASKTMCDALEALSSGMHEEQRQRLLTDLSHTCLVVQETFTAVAAMPAVKAPAVVTAFDRRNHAA